MRWIGTTSTSRESPRKPSGLRVSSGSRRGRDLQVQASRPGVAADGPQHSGEDAVDLGRLDAERQDLVAAEDVQ